MVTSASWRVPLIFIASTLPVTRPAAAQKNTSIPTFTLNTVASNPIAVPPFPSVGTAQCDDKGNVYFAVTPPGNYSKTILRISDDGQSAKPFLLPEDLGAEGNWNFYVDPGGTIYALFSRSDKNRAHILIELSASGEELHRTVWQVPENLYVYSFAVLPGGRAMVRGEVPLTAEPSGGADHEVIEQSGPYTAWLDTNGRPIREVRKTADGNKVVAANDWRSSAIALGPQETFLSTVGHSLNVYSPAGLLLHSSTIPKPDSDASPNAMEFVDGQAAIAFESTRQIQVRPQIGIDPDSEEPTTTMTIFVTTWLLVNPENGLPHGFFKMPESFIGGSLCYQGNSNFLYEAVKDGHTLFVRAQPH